MSAAPGGHAVPLAASTAPALIFAYPEQERDNLALARLAREELRHFEQVTRMLRRLGVAHRRLRPGRYASGLRAAAAPDDELRLHSGPPRASSLSA
jgi:tRNA-(ms[2]io[6]A)-hydroxylase